MPKRTPRDWEELERELHAAGVSPGGNRGRRAQAPRDGAREPARRRPQADRPDAERPRRRARGEHCPDITDRARRRDILRGHRPVRRSTGRPAGPSRRLRRPHRPAACQRHRPRRLTTGSVRFIRWGSGGGACPLAPPARSDRPANALLWAACQVRCPVHGRRGVPVSGSLPGAAALARPSWVRGGR